MHISWEWFKHKNIIDEFYHSIERSTQCSYKVNFKGRNRLFSNTTLLSRLRDEIVVLIYFADLDFIFEPKV